MKLAKRGGIGGRKLALVAWVLAACGALCRIAQGAELTVLPGVFVTNHVADGSAATQSGRLEVASEGRLYKTGGGTWTIPEKNVDQHNPLAIRVTNGKVSFAAATGETPAAQTLSEGVKKKLLFWGDASDPDASHFVGATSNDTGAVYVDAWYDVRETNPASPTRMYVTADRRHTEFSPQKVTTNGYEALWFGGFSSGRIYNWRSPNGGLRNAGNSQVMHVFAVHGVLASFGTIFGSTNGSASSYVALWTEGTAAASLTAPYWWRSEWCDTHNGRTWLDGERIDGHATQVKKGFHLLEAAMGRYDVGFVNSFFSSSTTKYRTGGDYLCEALAFTNRLTEVERLEVQNYLMRKWFGPGRSHKDVMLAPGTEVVVDTSSGDTADLQILPHGPGAFVKTGSFPYTQATTPPADFTGAMRIDAGAVTMLATFPVHVEAGDRVTAMRVPAGPRLTVAHDAGNGNLVKDGKEGATIAGVPSGVKSLTVEAGVLTIRAPGTNDVLEAGDLSEVFIENAGFEDHAPDEIVGGVVNVGYGAKHGWNRSGGHATFIYDHTLWTTGVTVNGTQMADAASASAWDCVNVPPPEGNRALLVRGNTRTWTTVTLDRPGVYELEVKARFRMHINWYVRGVAVMLTADANDAPSVAEFGMLRQMMPMYSSSNTPFETYRMRAPVAAAGTYRLVFEALNPYGTMLDDLHLRRLPDEKMTWPLPGGTFERATLLNGVEANVTVFTNANTMEGWTFTQPDGWTDTKPAVGLATFNMKGRYRDRGGYYNDSRGRSAGGNVELLFRRYGSSAVTTFTPPAGTWWLQAKLGRFNTNAGTLDATVAIGGETIRLGAIDPKGRMMGVCQWPTNFTADGTSAVTLTLTQTGNTGTEAGVWADDFELAEAFTPDAETELVKDGGFELSNNWTSIPTTNGSSWIGRTYKEAHWAFGYDPSGGSKFCSMHRMGGVMQDVTLPHPGRYRMSYRSKGRINWADFNGGTYRPFPTHAYLVKDGVTNILGRSSHQSTNYVQNVFDFTAKQAGVYTLAIQGLWSSEYPSGAEAHVDDVSLRALPGTVDRSPPFDKDMRISVADGALLRLDFEGTNRVESVRLGGRSVTGIIDAQSHPDFIAGDGALECLARGIQVIVR